MEFKSKTELAEHFRMLEKEKWVTSEWIVKHNGDITIGNKMFKINFNRTRNDEV